MPASAPKTRILFFIGSLRAGGKERRLLELLSYLKKTESYELLLVISSTEIQYDAFDKLNIPYRTIHKLWDRYDLSVFFKLYAISREFQPHIIHTWGRKQTFYALPTVVAQGIKLVNSQITSAPPKMKRWSIDYIIDQINFILSDAVLSNSKAGLQAYNPPANKSKIIYNGLNMTRFTDLAPVEEIKEKYDIRTPLAVVMAASVSPNKDYSLFYEVGRLVTEKVHDVSFIGVGWYIADTPEYKAIEPILASNKHLLFGGRISDVESLINACDIGVLFSNTAVHGEGLSNAILECMALGKPVVANDAGGTRELIHHDENGYLITNETPAQIADTIIGLLQDKSKQLAFGNRSRDMIERNFTIDKMGSAFVELYAGLLKQQLTQHQQAPALELMK